MTYTVSLDKKVTGSLCQHPELPVGNLHPILAWAGMISVAIGKRGVSFHFGFHIFK